MPRSFGSSQVTFRPPIQIWPAWISIRPAMALSKVDLPQPDGPSSTTNSDSATSRSSFPSTLTAPYPISTPLMSTLHGFFTAPALYGARRNAAHKPAARGEVDDERDQRGQQGGRHVHIVGALTLRRIDDVIKLDGHRQILASGEDKTENEVVPDAGHLQNDCDDEHGRRHWQHDRPEDAKESRAVDACCLEKLGRKGCEVIAEQQRHHRQPEDGVDDDDAEQRIVYAEHGEDAHQGIDEYLSRNERDDHHRAEQDAGAADAPIREGVSGQRPDRD